jgi:hypothetical protein
LSCHDIVVGVLVHTFKVERWELTGTVGEPLRTPQGK